MATDRQRPLQTNLLNRRICRLCFIYNKFVKLQTLILHLYQFICQKHICIDNIGSLYVKIVASKTTFPTVKSPIYDLNSSNSILLYDNENIIFTSTYFQIDSHPSRSLLDITMCGDICQLLQEGGNLFRVHRFLSPIKLTPTI